MGSKASIAFSFDTYLCTFTHLSLFDASWLGTADILDHVALLVALTLVGFVFSTYWWLGNASRSILGMSGFLIHSDENILRSWLHSPFPVHVDVTEGRKAELAKEMSPRSIFADIRRRHLLDDKHYEIQRLDAELTAIETQLAEYGHSRLSRMTTA